MDKRDLLTIRAMGLGSEGQMTHAQWEQHCADTPGLAEAWAVDARNPARALSGFDAAVLDIARQRPGQPTYVIRNWLSSRGLNTSTARVLRACRRLEQIGLIKEVPSSYAVMKIWSVPDHLAIPFSATTPTLSAEEAGR